MSRDSEEERETKELLAERQVRARLDADAAEVERLEKEANRKQDHLDRLTTGRLKLASRLNNGGLPEGFRDSITTTTKAVLDWKDRLRVLFGAGIITETLIYTENLPGKMESIAEVSVVFPRRPRRGPPVCYEAIPPEPDIDQLGDLP